MHLKSFWFNRCCLVCFYPRFFLSTSEKFQFVWFSLFIWIHNKVESPAELRSWTSLSSRSTENKSVCWIKISLLIVLPLTCCHSPSSRQRWCPGAPWFSSSPRGSPLPLGSSAPRGSSPLTSCGWTVCPSHLPSLRCARRRSGPWAGPRGRGPSIPWWCRTSSPHTVGGRQEQRWERFTLALSRQMNQKGVFRGFSSDLPSEPSVGDLRPSSVPQDIVFHALHTGVLSHFGAVGRFIVLHLCRHKPGSSGSTRMHQQGWVREVPAEHPLPPSAIQQLVHKRRQLEVK